MMNNRKINSIFIGISIFLAGLVSCENSGTTTTSDKITGHSNVSEWEMVYHMVKPEQLDPETINIDSLFVQVAYELKPDMQLLIGKSTEQLPEGLKLLIVNPLDNYNLLFRSRGAWESWILHPTFFKPENPDQPLIILLAQGTSDSWGQGVFMVKNDVFTELGYMDVTRKEQADTAFYEGGFRLTDISPFTEIYSKNGLLNFNFTCDSVFLYGSFGEQVDITFSGDRIGYVFDGDSLRLEILTD